MITTIHLHGALAKFAGREKWKFDIARPYQAIDALEMARPGFRAQILKMNKHVFMVRVGRRLLTAEQYAKLPQRNKTLHITPILEAAATGKGIFQIIAGVVLIAAGIIFAPYLGAFAPYVVSFGVALALGGVAQLLAPTPATDQQKQKKNSGSYIFNGAENSMEQGGCVPVMLGMGFCGSKVASVDINVVDITKGSTGGGGGGGGGGGNSLTGDPHEPGVPIGAQGEV